MTAVSSRSGRERLRLPLLDHYLREQRELTAVDQFAQAAGAASHASTAPSGRYRALLPASPPGDGQQYAFEVDLDGCSGCKSCVTACHSLNGLDDGETWRAVGLLHGGSAAAPMKQMVTTACHHCLDPACMSGCPVGAYEKDSITGIVKHLDDQCIGCQYCTFACPYEVPQYNPRLGIVRKCDMCSGRLSAGEAPACVQACPNEAIAITVVDKRQVLEDTQGDAFLPGSPSPAITIPTTIYRSERARPRNLLPADFYRIAPAPRHVPLVVMLVLTQLSAGAFAIDALLGCVAADLRIATQPTWSLALPVALIALAASVFHLGRPLYAFRAVIGLRTSWMSREIVAFGAFALLGVAYAGLSLLHPSGLLVAIRDALRWAVATLGVIGVACSVMIYHATRRAWWTFGIAGFKFFATAALLGLSTLLLAVAIDERSESGGRGPAGLAGGEGILPFSIDGAGLPHGAIAALSMLVVATSAIKAAGELAVLLHLRDRRYTELKRSAVLLTRDLRGWFVARFAALALGGIALPLANLRGEQLGATVASFALVLCGELLERTLFFAAASSNRMPGGLR